MTRGKKRTSTQVMMDAIVKNATRIVPFQLPAVILHETPTEQILDDTVDNLLNMHMQVIESVLEGCLKRTIECSYFYSEVSNRSEPYVICTDEEENRWDYVIPEIFFAPSVWVPTKSQLEDWLDWLLFCNERSYSEIPDIEHRNKTIDEWAFFRTKEVLRGVYAHAEKLHKGFAPFNSFVVKYGEDFRTRAIQKKSQEEDILRETRLHLINSGAPSFLIDEYYDRKMYRVKEVRRKLRGHHHK